MDADKLTALIDSRIRMRARLSSDLLCPSCHASLGQPTKLKKKEKCHSCGLVGIPNRLGYGSEENEEAGESASAEAGESAGGDAD